MIDLWICTADYLLRKSYVTLESPQGGLSVDKLSSSCFDRDTFWRFDAQIISDFKTIICGYRPSSAFICSWIAPPQIYYQPPTPSSEVRSSRHFLNRVALFFCFKLSLYPPLVNKNTTKLLQLGQRTRV